MEAQRPLFGAQSSEYSSLEGNWPAHCNLEGRVQWTAVFIWGGSFSLASHRPDRSRHEELRIPPYSSFYLFQLSPRGSPSPSAVPTDPHTCRPFALLPLLCISSRTGYFRTCGHRLPAATREHASRGCQLGPVHSVPGGNRTQGRDSANDLSDG